VDGPVTSEPDPSPHRIVNPESLAPPVGYAHAVVAATGRTIYLGGQTAHDADGVLRGDTLAEQFEMAADNLVRALAAAGGRPEHLVSMQIYVTDAAAYRSSLGDIGTVYRRFFGPHFPAMALLEVSGLFDPAAKVELVATAVVPDE
jgi:enamine deaminase RidA (YjgF/YER057c/UK114 family)